MLPMGKKWWQLHTHIYFAYICIKIFLEEYTGTQYWLSLGRGTGWPQDRGGKEYCRPFFIIWNQNNVIKYFLSIWINNSPKESFYQMLLLTQESSSLSLAVSTRGLLGVHMPSRRELRRVARKPKSQRQRAWALCLYLFSFSFLSFFLLFFLTQPL